MNDVPGEIPSGAVNGRAIRGIDPGAMLLSTKHEPPVLHAVRPGREWKARAIGALAIRGLWRGSHEIDGGTGAFHTTERGRHTGFGQEADMPGIVFETAKMGTHGLGEPPSHLVSACASSADLRSCESRTNRRAKRDHRTPRSRGRPA